MQLFNGLNMWIIKFYGLNFDNTPETRNGNTEDINYTEKLNTINQKINELKNEDQNTENDAAANAAKETLNKLINTEFLNWFIKSLNEDQKNSLKGTLKQLLYAHKNEENFKKEYMWLIDLATALGVNLEWGTETSEQPTEPKLELSWTLSWIEGPKKKGDWSYEEWEKKLYSQLTREASQEWQNIPDDKNFYKTSENVKTQLESVRWLLKNEKLKDNESLKWLEDNLVAIQTVIDNTTPDNVRILQKFISDNLDWEDKEAFDDKSKKGENFDWKFWLGTLAWLNKVLEKTWEYIDSCKNQPSEWVEDEPFKNVKVKESIVLPGLNAPISAADLLESLPNGATAEFKNNVWIDKSKTGDQEVTVVVRSWDKTKEITIIATVDTTKKVGLKIKENWNPTTPTAPETTPTSETTETSTTPAWPLEITINGQAEKHPVVTSDVAKKINTPLYYVNTWNEAASEQNNKVDENGDREYLMQVNNETYKVKLDQNWNLKPLAINYESGAKLLLKNNLSCIAYLQSKIPENLPGSPRIARNPNMEDYVIRSTTDRWVKWLTIEPMTLDGKWLVWSNLWNNLALLNFTNFLRWNENIDNLKFKNDNPDLKLDNGKLYVRIKKWTRLADDSKSGKWYEVNLSKFWISQNALEDFIKYNNSEDWNDNWDKKKDNKGYTKIDFPTISGPAAPAATETTTTTVPITQPTVNHENGGNPATTPQHTEITTPAPTTQNTDIFPNVPNLSKEEKIKLREILSNPLELWNFVGGKFVFKGWLEKTEWSKNYIEVDVGGGKKVRINEYQENMNWLWYKKEDWKFYIWEFKEWKYNWEWTRFLSGNAKYIWEWKDDLQNWKWFETHGDWSKYEWSFENWKRKWEWAYIWSNWNKFEWTFEGDKFVKWIVYLKDGGINSFQVEGDSKWLKIIALLFGVGDYFLLPML